MDLETLFYFLASCLLVASIVTAAELLGGVL